LNNLKKFIAKWENVKHSDSTKILSKKVMSEINNLKRHITKGCLSGIDVGCGTSRDERLHREMNKIVSTNRLGVELGHARLNNLFMKINKDRDCTDSWPTTSELKVIAAKELYEDNTEILSESTPTQSNCNTNGKEVFGIRPKKRTISMSTMASHTETPAEVLPIKGFTCEILTQLQEHIQQQIVKASKIEENDQVTSSTDNTSCLILEIIKQALAWWAASFTIQTVLGEKCLKKKEIPSLVRARMNCKINSKLFSYKNNDDDVEKLAKQLGYTVIDIPKDGDCLFKSVAFQLFQLSNNCNNSASELTEHLLELGINIQTGTIDDVADKLRELVVNEWQGEFQEDYADFFQPNDQVHDSVAFMQESEKYRKKGTFAGSLGDSMPLALANMLKLPLMILSTEHNVPFIDICPRNVITNAVPVFLARYNAGGGHYNAIILDEIDHQEANIPTSTNSSIAISNPTGTGNERLTCRCDSSKRKRSLKYKNRCGCIKVAGLCQTSCKCDGKCGKSSCKLQKDEMNTQNVERNTGKRMRHEFQKFSPLKGKHFLSVKQENLNKGPLNVAEYFLLRTIVNNLLLKKDPSWSSHVGNLYNDAIHAIRHDKLLAKIPVESYENSRIKKEARKMLLKDDKLDQFA
jgi:hypothetical protein